MRPLALALSFLTRVPVTTGAVEPHEAAASLPCFPIVGALIGALLWLLSLLLAPLLGPWLSALCLVAASALITGALHLDGVADLFDALGGGRGERARMLDIMRDPRVGAHGATGLMLVLAGKLIASAELLMRGPHAGVWAIVLAPIWARFVCVLAIKAFAYARPSGLGLAFHVHARKRHVVLAAMPCALAIALLLRQGAAPPGLLTSALAISSVLCLLLALRVKQLLGGITGDVHGACIELCELLVLVVACARD